MERKENVAHVKRLIQEKMAANQALSELARFLISKGITKSLADEIVLELKKKTAADPLSQLKEQLSCRIKTSHGFAFAKKMKKVALVGPTGVGKTTLILKLADFYKKKKIALISLDHEKGGAYAQLEKYAKVWKLPLYSHIEEMKEESVDLVLIDTSGCNTYQPESVDVMGSLLSTIPEVEIHLTVSAAAKEVDLYGAIHQFSALRPSSLIFTKLDETLSSGALVTLSSRVDLPISFVAYGYPLPGKIEPADPAEIAHKILTDLNQEQFHSLRSLAHSPLS